MRAIQTAELRCKYCNSTEVVKAGKRRLNCGIKQLYKCNGCLRKFSNLHRNRKQTDPEVILKTLILVCRGYSYEQASRFILRKYQTLISTSVISKWVKEYKRDIPTGKILWGWTVTTERSRRTAFHARYRFSRENVLIPELKKTAAPATLETGKTP